MGALWRNEMKTLDELMKEAALFRDERNWRQFHNPKDLAISVSLEAAELLEIFQWSAEDVEVSERTDEIKEELADVMLYALLLADRLGLDPAEIIEDKLEKNREKYPVEKAYGSKKKYTELKKEKRN